jgi:hypothetical protein
VAFANGIRNISLHRGRIHLRDNTAIIIEREFAELRLANQPSSSAMFFAAILCASSLLSNLAAERRPHGAGLWP